MSNQIYLWMLNENVEVRTEINESVTKISNIRNHLYLLTVNNNLYHGFVQNQDNNFYIDLEYVRDLKLVDIDSCKDYLFIVNRDGNVYKCSENLEVLNEIELVEEYLCVRGHNGTKCKMKVKNIAIGEYGKLFITDVGHLWGSGYMPQIGINCENPKRVNFFMGRFVYNVNVGNDFAIAIVSKQIKPDDNDSDEEEVFPSNCPKCLSASQLTSPTSLTSISDVCPLGVKVLGSYDIETTSTSSKNDSSVSSNEKINENGNEQNLEAKVEKNIIFRNTEAAKEFLTRQISRMSSAGEEYLVECTEKPTRIIKENMTNVASLVYEGVKTVGDKVVTLSRHVSGSSDCNSVIENTDEHKMHKSNSKDEILLSVSQCTSEKDLSEHEIQERISLIVKTGSNILNCEVWTWGNIVHGQLDISDITEGNFPFLPSDNSESVNPILQFFNKIIGTHNEYKLPSPTGIGDNIKRERPMIITKLSNIGVKKVSVQSFHAAVLTLDGRAYIWGQNDHNQVTLENNFDQSSPKLFLNQNDERVKDIICGEHFTTLLTNTHNVVYFGKGTVKTTNLYKKEVVQTDLDDHKINCFTNLISSKQYILLNNGYCDDNIFLNFLSEEQKMLEEMLTVQINIIKPLQKKNINSPNASLLENLCRTYSDLLYFWTANVQSMLEYCNDLISINDIIIFKYSEEHLSVYKSYINVIHNITSVNGYANISKLVDISANVYKLRPDCFPKKEKNNEEVISTILISPLHRINSYKSIIEHFCIQTDQKNKDVLNKWNEFIEEFEVNQKQAQLTNEFWSNGGKQVEFLKTPERRLLKDSHKDPINLLNASRFSSHWFILFNDLFVHFNGSTSTVVNLSIIWIEPQQDDSSQQHQIILKMPEHTLTLATVEAEQKIEWFRALQNAVKNALNRPDALQPPAVRNGVYTFTKTGFFKDAKYTGRWLNAKMHGNGMMEWPDGKVYVGQFINNQLNGYGEMVLPNVGEYEGQWKDNQKNGLGCMKYCNNDIYKGHFKDGMSHGHGFLRKGNFMASMASFYIGDWISGSKCGYGVMDDIVTGEKYIGNWFDNKKEGTGIIVTSDGVYYEGNFHQDVFTGHGIMILEDSTHYEGEFRGTGILNGKGTLTLPSGHMVEGNMNGSWNEGIKINGTFTRNNGSKLPKSFETLCTPVNLKWRALFKNCYQVLGIQENKNGVKDAETQRIWQNVAVYLSNATSLKQKKTEKNFSNSLNNLDIIPPYGMEKLNMDSFTEVKNYLLKAFESPFHPLGSLLNDLSEAYNTTYGGRAHPLLLKHAITELIYITKKLYEIVRYLFPGLPIYGKDILIENEEGDCIINYQSLLYPIILPKVHHPLFTLFTLNNEEQERQYKRTLIEWNKQSDYTLMAFLSVDQKFFKTDESFTHSPLKNHVFIEAIETLQQIKSTFSPTEKLYVIIQTVEKMKPVAQEILGKSYIWNMDDLFPLFLYVVVRARIPDLGSELDFVENFMDPSLESGELGIMFITLKACYQQILKEKSSSV